MKSGFSAYQISSQLFFTMNAHSPCRGNPLSLQGQGKRTRNIHEDSIFYHHEISQLSSRETCSPPEPLGRWPKGKARG